MGRMEMQQAVLQFYYNYIEYPVVWFHDNIVDRRRTKYAWYHEKFPRVPTVDQCFTDDRVCIYEANHQFKRDRLVDTNIMHILRKRYEDCVMIEKPDHNEICVPLYRVFEDAMTNWFIKYGDLGMYADSRRCYNKQKHRMAWERRHGPVGSGMKGDETNVN